MGRTITEDAERNCSTGEPPQSTTLGGEQCHRQNGKQNDHPHGTQSATLNGEQCHRQNGKQYDPPRDEQSTTLDGGQCHRQNGKQYDPPRDKQGTTLDGEQCHRQNGKQYDPTRDKQSATLDGGQCHRQNGKQYDPTRDKQSTTLDGGQCHRKNGKQYDPPRDEQSTTLDGEQCHRQNSKQYDPPRDEQSTTLDGEKCHRQNGKQYDPPRGEQSATLDGEQCHRQNGKQSDPPHGEKSSPPDGRYGWVIVFSSFLSFFLADGILFSFGILLVVLIEELNESTTAVAALGGIFMGCFALSAPLSGSLVDVFGKRYVTIFGSFLFSLGLFASMFAKSIGVLYVSYGILGGFGLGLMVTPPLSSVMEHFSKRRALAGGIALCGSGIGTFVMNPVTNLLLERYKSRGTFLILSGLILNGVACGLVIPQTRKKGKRDKEQDKTCAETVETPCPRSLIQRVKRKLYKLLCKNYIPILRDFRCICILLSAFCFGLASFVPFSYLPKQAVELGMEKHEAAWLSSATGITNTLSRIGIGWLGSRSFANRRILSACILLLDAACFPASLVLTSFNTKLIYALVYGALYGANIVLLPVILADSVLAEHVDKTIGLFLLMFCGGGVIGVPLAGWTVDITGDFNVCYILAGTETIFAAILLMLPTIRDFCTRTVLGNRTTHL